MPSAWDNPSSSSPKWTASLAEVPGSAFVRERRYLVIKLKDAQEFLTPDERAILEILSDVVTRKRRLCGKRELQCVVVESDWPEYEPTWRAIEARSS